MSRAWLPAVLCSLGAILALAGCPTKVVHKCPTQKTCSHPSHRVRPRRQASPPRKVVEPARGYRFRKPHRYALPTSIRDPRSVAFSPDGGLMAVGGRWGRMEVVRTTDGRSLYSLGRTDELVRGLLVRFTPSGRHLVSARHKLTRVRIWDRRTGRMVRELRAKGYPIRDLALTKDHRALLATSVGVEIWNTATGRHERTLKMRYDLPVTRVSASPSGLSLAGDRAGNVLLFTPADGRRHGRLMTPGKRLAALHLASDGALAAIAYQNGMVRVAGTSPFRRVRGFSWWTRGTPLRLGFAARKGTVVVVADSTGRIDHVSTRSGKLLYRQRSRAKTSTDVALSRDGRLLASAATSGGVELWQTEEAKQRLKLPRRYKQPPLYRAKATFSLVRPVRIDLETPGVNIAGFAVGKRGKFLALAGKPTRIAVYYLVTRPRRKKRPYAKRLYLRKPRKRPEKRLRREPLQVAITPDRNWLIANGGGFHLSRWALLSGRHLRRRLHDKPLLRSLLPTHNSKTLITVGPGSQVFGWNLRGQRRFELNGVSNPYWVGVTRKGRTFLQIQGWDRMVAFALPSGKRLWDNASGPLAEFEVVAMRFTPDSQRLVTFHKSGFLRYHDVATGVLLTRIRIPMVGKPGRCDIRPDAKVMACAVHDGVALLELPNGALIRTLRIRGVQRRAFRIRDIGYSPRGNTLVVQTGRQRLVVYNFDHPGKAIRYTGIDAMVRVRLGLPIVAPRIRVKPGAVPKPGLIKPTKPLRHRRTIPRRRTSGNR